MTTKMWSHFKAPHLLINECQIHDVDAVIARGLIGLLIFVLAKAARGHVRKFTVSSALVESFHGTTSISHFSG